MMGDDVVSASCDAALCLAVNSGYAEEVNWALLGTRGDVPHEHFGQEGSLVNMAIENASYDSPEPGSVLACLLGIEYPYSSSELNNQVALPEGRGSLINLPCDSDGLTPLMKASKVGSLPCVKMLLSCGADVNHTSNGQRAIHYSIDEGHSNITLLLLEKDSITPEKYTPQWINLQMLIKEMGVFQQFFNDREEVYRSLCADFQDKGSTDFLESRRYCYHVNHKGRSILYRSGKELRHNLWACLLAYGFKYSSDKEERKMNEIKKTDPDGFMRALEEKFHSVPGCHVMKMVDKSLIFGKARGVEGLGRRMEALYTELDGNRYTSVLLHVLQDVPRLNVVFDFEAADVSRMRAEGFKMGAIADLECKKAFVAALGCKDDGNHEGKMFLPRQVVGNLARGLCSLVLNEVFGNNGLPYRRDELVGMDSCAGVDDARRRKGEEYQKIVTEIMRPENLKNCDHIIKQTVSGYCRSKQWDNQLILCIPEMVARCRTSNEVGPKELEIFQHLDRPVSQLWLYFQNYVLPECDNYVKCSFRSGCITLRDVLDFEVLVSPYHLKSVQVKQDTTQEWLFHDHNGLKVLKVSSLSLGNSHVKLHFKRKNKSTFSVGWNNYNKCREMFLTGLRCREFVYLVVTWDAIHAPEFCDSATGCLDKACIGNEFGPFMESVVLLVPGSQCVPNDVIIIDYGWEDLSPETQKHGLERIVDFGGKIMTMGDIIKSLEGFPESFDESCVQKYLQPSDLTNLLEAKSGCLCLGRPILWPEACPDSSRIFVCRKKSFIERTLCCKCVYLKAKTIHKHPSYYFVIVGAVPELLYKLGIEERYVARWTQNSTSCNSHMARCYILDEVIDGWKVQNTFEDIVKFHMSKGMEGKFFLLKLKGGLFLLVRSLSNGKETNLDEVEEDFISQYRERDMLVSKELSSTEPIVIVDGPGCGKTTYLNKLALDLKKKFPYSWVAFVELSIVEQEKQLNSLQRLKESSDEEAVGRCVRDILFNMVQGGEWSFERRLFYHLASMDNKVFVLIDGLDEVWPKYKEDIVSFLKALRIHTKVKLIVATRPQEKHGLEEHLVAIIYTFVPFSNSDQVKFLGNYWNDLLRELPPDKRVKKYEAMQDGMRRIALDGPSDGEDISSLIRQLDAAKKGTLKSNVSRCVHIEFNTFVLRLIRQTSWNMFSEARDQFTGIPLHLQMLGLILFEDSFHMEQILNRGHLYTRFFEIQVKIFTREKALTPSNMHGEILTKMGQITAMDVVEDISAHCLQEEKTYHLMGSGLVIAQAIGLVTNVSGLSYRFVHSTFVEFFFAKWLLRKAGKGYGTRFWLRRLFLEDKFSGVRSFVEDVLRLLSRGVLTPDGSEEVLLMQDRSQLDLEALPEPEAQLAIRRCLYAHVLGCHLECLTFLLESFGDRAARPLLDDRDSASLEPGGKDGHPQDALCIAMNRWRRQHGAGYANVFTFAAYCLSDLSSHSSPDYLELLVYLLELACQFHLEEEMGHLILEEGLTWLIPACMFYW